MQDQDEQSLGQSATSLLISRCLPGQRPPVSSCAWAAHDFCAPRPPASLRFSSTSRPRGHLRPALTPSANARVLWVLPVISGDSRPSRLQDSMQGRVAPQTLAWRPGSRERTRTGSGCSRICVGPNPNRLVPFSCLPHGQVTNFPRKDIPKFFRHYNTMKFKGFPKRFRFSGWSPAMERGLLNCYLTTATRPKVTEEEIRSPHLCGSGARRWFHAFDERNQQTPCTEISSAG